MKSLPLSIERLEKNPKTPFFSTILAIVKEEKKCYNIQNLLFENPKRKVVKISSEKKIPSTKHQILPPERDPAAVGQTNWNFQIPISKNVAERLHHL